MHDHHEHTSHPSASAQLEKLLRHHGITPTQQRLQIAAVMLNRPQHLAAEQILARVNADGSQVSKATVYNTLGLFAAKGLVRELVVDPSKVFYDSNVEPHHHLYDVTTGELTDIRVDSVAVEGLPEVPEGAVVEGVDVIVRIRSPRPA